MRIRVHASWNVFGATTLRHSNAEGSGDAALLVGAATIAGDDTYDDHDHDPPDRPLLPPEHSDGSSSTTSTRRSSGVQLFSRTKPVSPSTAPPALRTSLSKSISNKFAANTSSSQKRSGERPVPSSRRQGATSTHDGDRDRNADEGRTAGGSGFPKSQCSDSFSSEKGVFRKTEIASIQSKWKAN